jgi:uncharacterized iron-regulated membrane protein
LSVFHWELEDASVSAAWKPTDLHAMEARLDGLAPPGSGKQVSMIWTTAGLADRYDVWVKDSREGRTSLIRIAGDGTVLRVRDSGSRNVFAFVIELHQSLLAGKRGRWIVGLSGLLLISSLALGLRSAWPKEGRWRAALWPKKGRSPHGRLLGWHRSLGLVFALPALVLFAAGTALAYKDSLSPIIGARPPTMAANPSTQFRSTGFENAVEAAFAAAHTRRLSAVEMPADEDATYRIRVLAPGEHRRAFGTTTIFIDARSGAVRGVFPPFSQPIGQRLINALYAIHTGEIGGPAGRLLVLAVGAWLMTMLVLGLRMWLLKTRNSAKSLGSGSASLAQIARN